MVMTSIPGRNAFIFATLLAGACGSDGARDTCPDDPSKSEAGACGCGVPDTDANDNAIPDCFDTLVDLCPDDDSKTEGGVCGCGMSDTDGNENGVPDCLDASIDFCPNDPEKTLPGVCGCGFSDADVDTSGTPDCVDPKLIFLAAVPGGNLGGITGADARCNAAPNKPNGATYKAMLAGVGRRACTSSLCINGGAGEHEDWVLAPNRAYYRPDGAFIGRTDALGLFTFPLQASIGTTAAVGYTGMTTGWVTDVDTCISWTVTGSVHDGRGGDVNVTNVSMLSSTARSCQSSSVLYCVAQ